MPAFPHVADGGPAANVRGRGCARYFLGSVSHQLAHHAHQPEPHLAGVEADPADVVASVEP